MLSTEAALKHQEGILVALDTPFGELTIPEQLIIQFPEGIYGFENLHHFALIEVPGHDENSEHRLLQSLENPSFCLVVTALGEMVPQKDVIPYVEEKDLKIENVVLWSILSFHRRGQTNVTANLKAPIVLDLINRQGWQIILYHADYPVDFPLPKGK